MRLLTPVAATILMSLAAGGAPNDLPPLEVEVIAEELRRPAGFVQDSMAPSTQFVVLLDGPILAVVDGEVLAEPFIDLSDRLGGRGPVGLLGLAFPSHDPTDHRFYCYYIADDNDPDTEDPIRMSRFQRDEQNPLRGLPDSEEILIEIPREQEGHTGGNMMFGPDGMLYIGVGDGRLAGGADHGPQQPDTLLGKMLRIDVSPETGYDIPPDNPFLDGDPIDALPEIWSFGWRNPWRWSFDDVQLGGTGAIIIGDVGFHNWEEVSYEPAAAGGRNYGWPNREGAHDRNGWPPPAFEPLIDPIWEYEHDDNDGHSVTGGFVYRGRDLGAAYHGRYFVAEFEEQRLWTLGLDQSGEATVTDVIEHTAEIGGEDVVGNTSSFGVDSAGELYLVSYASRGKIKRIRPRTTRSPNTDIAVLDGTLIAGGLADIEWCDGDVLETQALVTGEVARPHFLRLLIGAQAESQASDVFITIKGSITDLIAQTTLLLHNWQTGEFEPIGQFPMTMDISTETVRVPDAGSYVRADGRVELELRQIVFFPFTLGGYHTRLDVIEVRILP